MIAFYIGNATIPMKDELSEQQSAAILKALEEAIEQGPWDDSNFLKVIGKNLRDIRDTFSNQLHAPTLEKSKLELRQATKNAERVGQQEVFIALYSSDGTNIQTWERILMNLPRQMISRPIYPNEEDVKAVIRTKENKNNEAYVSMFINQNDILTLSVDKTPVDRLGKPLLTLKDKSLSLENIIRFVHLTNVYHYKYGRLIKDSTLEPS